MFDHIVRFSLQQRWFVLFAFVALSGLGIFNFFRLPIDAVPDITNVQVQINTAAPGFSPLETEQRITLHIEALLAGLPHLKETRSLSRYELSQVTVIFDEGTDIYFARQLVNERLQRARESLPPGLDPELGPISTGLGEIYMYTVENAPNARRPLDLRELRAVQDWVIKPQLVTVPGVNEINSIGGDVKQYLVQPDPARLAAVGLTVSDLLTALSANNTNQGLGYIEKSGEQYLMRLPGQLRSLEEIGATAVSTRKGATIHVRDVASLTLGGELRTGAATENGREVVVGTVMMLIGGNSRTVAAAVDKKMAAIRKTLPEGVRVRTVYDRTRLVEATIRTVEKNLLEGALLVIAVLFAFLGNLRAALITALVIPVVMLLTITGLLTQNISANLMSLGALDFGIIIDGAVVIVENSLRKLAERQQADGRPLTQEERFQTIQEAARESRHGLLYGQLIIMAVYLPLLTLRGVEGKMFIPMAATVVMALLAAMVLSVTLVPAALSTVLRHPAAEKENRLVRWTLDVYRPRLDWTLMHKRLVFGAAATLVVFSLLLALRMGAEFIPTLNEGDIALETSRIPGTSVSQAVAMESAVEKRLKRFPEVSHVFSRIGTAEIASDPMPPSSADIFIILKPREQWPDPGKTKDKLVREIRQALVTIPGSSYEFSQPIQMRFNELLSGVKGDVAIKVYGDDMAALARAGEQIADVLKRVPGATGVKVEQVSGLPTLTLVPRRDMLARYGLSLEEVQRLAAAFMAGETAGEIYEGDRRFDLVVRLPDTVREDIDALKRLPVPLPDEAHAIVPLGTLVEFQLAPGPNQVSRENGKRRVVVTANVEGRDIGSFVDEARSGVDANVRLPPGYWLGWGGTFEQLQSAKQRLMIVVPLALLIILALLYASFGELLDGLLVFTGVPLALTGGLVALAVRGIPLSISAGVGFIALSGVAVLNGLVMVSYIRQLRAEGIALEVAVREGAATRLRPVLMTALVAALGFIPMAFNTGIGAEVQRPLATVVIGGILTSTVLTLMVLPALYHWVHQRLDRASEKQIVSAA